MDWFKSGLQAAQKQAQEAAEKAKALAQQASAQARAIAEQASEQAKVLAEQASEQAKVLAEQATEHAKVFAEQASEKARLASEKAKTTSGGGASASDVDPAELAKYGITSGLLETIAGMTYSTFSDYPVELLPTTNPMGLTTPIPPPGFRLSPWQERHALLVLTKGDQLQGLRFALCPKRMSEEVFWIIYFTLVKTLLPLEAFAKDALEGSAAGEAVAAVTAGTLISASPSAKSLRAAQAGTTSTMPVSTHSSTSRLADEADDDDDDGAEGGEADLDELEDDPELAAYLEEALDVAEGGEAEGISDLGSATDDLDDYINQLDAELGADGGSGEGEGGSSSPQPKPVQEAA
ncbi:hypothetical protein VOLCADRAFT_116049 [Volvox carteri f. nagariensis]|uniref:BSD domain-containing protein n=1 Tax=Volvox carteri f. nagariensis TaxID=3068 RepID=D8TJK7_VOLCA|nr:uncharacterized protein VOLCADRAFT_116049 [Volvox carteri f. nagariensis]EFJ52389.1 hypothetical protein VOLCADRAFT_116049 [Volvox carteri f. nagariensis]|eukprot:XP_002946462.1 hypothetical protein VOLCADRAFT_116049 [Volvox carteri f. nagariensis]